jgi:hypothetical protein
VADPSKENEDVNETISKQKGEKARFKAKEFLIGLSLLAILVILSPLARLLPDMRQPSSAK